MDIFKKYERKFTRKLKAEKAIRALLSPFGYVGLAIDKAKLNHSNKLNWDEKTTVKILNKFIPKASFYDDQGYYTIYREDTLALNLRAVPRKYRPYARKFSNKIMQYLFDTYEVEGYRKEFESARFFDEDHINFYPKNDS